MAVYTPITHDDALTICHQYNIGALTAITNIQEGIENSNFILSCNRNNSDINYIFTIFEKRVNDDDIPYFLGLMEHLSRHNFPCPQPIKNNDGQYITTIYGKKAILVSFLHGKSLIPNAPHHYQQMGYYSALWHNKVSDFTLQRNNALLHDGWANIIQQISMINDPMAHELMPLITEEMAYIYDAWPKNLPEGAVHLDLFPNNIFFDSRQHISGVIDFYFAAQDYFIYDIGITLSAWVFNKNGDFAQQYAHDFLQAYTQERPLQDDEYQALPIMVRGAALRFLLTRLYDWYHTADNAFVHKLNPIDYRNILQCAQSLSVDSFYKHDR